MCALTPMLPTRLGWPPMEYPWHFNVDSVLNPLDSLAEPDNSNNYSRLITHSRSNSNGNSGGGHGEDQNVVMKKLSHNASERDRRKKLNHLYSSLRSLLPASDDMKKLSIPGTVSMVLKYIPEVRKDVERLCRRKEQLMKRISRRTSVSSAHHEQQRERRINTDMSPRILTSWLTDTEIAVHIATLNKDQIADTLLGLEENGFRVISVSSSVSSNSRVFHTLHLQTDEDCIEKVQELSDMILALQEKQDHDEWHL